MLNKLFCKIINKRHSLWESTNNIQVACESTCKSVKIDFKHRFCVQVHIDSRFVCENTNKSQVLSESRSNSQVLPPSAARSVRSVEILFS